jgi:hypothetical protein
MSIRRRSVLFGSLFAVLLFAQTALAGSPTPVKATNRDEFLGGSNGNFFGWTQDRAGHPKAIDAWYEPMPVGSGTPVRLNAGRDKAFAGQIDPTADEIGWQRIHRGNSDVRIYDMAGAANFPLPPGIDTSKWEWAPAVFGGQMTFARDARSGQTIYFVTNLTTGHKKAIKTTDYVHSYMFLPPRFYGNWIVYGLVTRRGWYVYEYDIALATTTKVHHPRGRFDYAPSVDLAGNIYFTRSTGGCGGIKLMKYPLGGPAVDVYDATANQDVNDTSVYDDGAGQVLVYVAFYDCINGGDDINVFTNPTASPIRRGPSAPRRVGQLPRHALGRFSGGVR